MYACSMHICILACAYKHMYAHMHNCMCNMYIFIRAHAYVACINLVYAEMHVFEFILMLEPICMHAHAHQVQKTQDQMQQEHPALAPQCASTPCITHLSSKHEFLQMFLQRVRCTIVARDCRWFPQITARPFDPKAVICMCMFACIYVCVCEAACTYMLACTYVCMRQHTHVL
jgi:hypothetical protein